jgi:hypothetical protein
MFRAAAICTSRKPVRLRRLIATASRTLETVPLESPCAGKRPFSFPTFDSFVSPRFAGVRRARYVNIRLRRSRRNGRPPFGFYRTVSAGPDAFSHVFFFFHPRLLRCPSAIVIGRVTTHPMNFI